MTEGQEQAFLFQWAGYMRQKYPELELLYHVPNGGKRDLKTAAVLKREGVKAGVPDLVLPVARRGYFGLYVELKVGKNKTSVKQDKWIQALKEQNYFTQVCYGWRNAADVIEDYLSGPATERRKNGSC